MKIYIWEGNGISAAYHDDGTLVVLAESPEQARQLMRDGVAERRDAFVEFERQRDAYLAELTPAQRNGWTRTPRGKEIWALWDYDGEWFDGSLDALDREPDRVVDIDKPTWVAFNGGGYD